MTLNKTASTTLKPVPVSLKAFAEQHANGVQKITHFKVDPCVLVIEAGFNIRTPGSDLDAHIASLKSSIKAGAYIPPLDVRVENGEIIIVDGHCRHAAVMELIAEGMEIIAVEVRQYRGSDAERVVHMLTSAQGKPLTPLECGHTYLRLKRFGWDAPMIALRAGKSTTHIDQLIMLAESNMDVQRMVAANAVPAHIAIDMLRKHGSKTGEMLQLLLEKAKSGGKTKVTNKIVNGASYSRDLVGRVVTSLDDFYSTLSSEVRSDLQTVFNGNTHELEGKMVTVTALGLKKLLDAHTEIAQSRLKESERQLRKQEKLTLSQAKMST